MKGKQFLVIGSGRFGTSVACTLCDMGHDVLVVDSNEANIQHMSQVVTHAVRADSTNEAALKAMGIPDFDVVVVAIGEDVQASIMTAILLKELGARQIVAKAQTELHGKVLAKIGVDRVIFPERDMGQKLAHSLASEKIIDLFELSDSYSVVEVIASREMVGKSLQQLDLRASYGVNVIAFRTAGGEVNVSPKASDLISDGDIIVAIGDNKALKKLGWI